MTGFSRIKIAGYLVEVQTINKKGSEVSLSLPRELGLKESFIRKKLASLLQRGHAYIKVFPEGKNEIKISKEACKRAHAYLEDIAKSLDSTYKVSFDNVLDVLSEFEVSNVEEGDGWETIWNNGLDELWSGLAQMKEKEGEALVKDIQLRLDLILQLVDSVEKDNHNAPEFYGKKILEKLESFKVIGDEDKDRVLREVMLYTEKVDITEEVVRMRSHISQMQNLFIDPKEPIGRTIDFLLQEMMREANTMGSKAPGLSSMNSVIMVKGEIEKIRQQGSNIE
jgi:uncharacterized protein (TIGR00255 family)